MSLSKDSYLLSLTKRVDLKHLMSLRVELASQRRSNVFTLNMRRRQILAQLSSDRNAFVLQFYETRQVCSSKKPLMVPFHYMAFDLWLVK